MNPRTFGEPTAKSAPPADPDTVYAGVEDATLLRSTDGGQNWQELPGLCSVKSNLWQPGAGGMGLHTIILDPRNPKGMVISIFAADAFRTDDGGSTWRPINQGTMTAEPMALSFLTARTALLA